MQTRRLGNSDMNITVLGFGAWAIGGGGWAFGWGPQDDADSITAIHEALDAGMNWIDTAAVYGLGRSEEVVGKALASYKGAKPYIFTKCSMRWDVNREIYRNLKADSVRQEVEASLKRLNVDVIDLYQIHWPNPEGEIEEGWAEMAKLVQEGKVRAIGVSNFSVAQMKRVQAIAPITSLQPPYHLLRRDIEDEILPYCKEQNIGVIVYSPMASGLLSGGMTRERIANFASDDWRRNHQEYQEPRLIRNLGLVDLLKEIGARHGKTAGDTAIAWTLRNPAVTGAIVGLRKPGQIAGVIGAADFQLSDAEAREIEQYFADHPVAA
ncbi:MAG TPA: aldo/keto reductase [Capsulimonadaceae bacterium]|nr:aldo/keto reductase [Capsulimonadaceae bacterium]